MTTTTTNQPIKKGDFVILNRDVKMKNGEVLPRMSGFDVMAIWAEGVSGMKEGEWRGQYEEGEKTPLYLLPVGSYSKG